VKISGDEFFPDRSECSDLIAYLLDTYLLTLINDSIVWCSFYRASSYASAVAGVVVLSVCLSVRPSVCPSRVLCYKIKHCTADILIPHEMAITLVF